jgi:spore coat protein H
MSIYQLERGGLTYFYLTIFESQAFQSQGNRLTFKDLNEDEDYKDTIKVELEVLLQEGNEEGPQNAFYGFGLQESNASMRLRGHSTREADLKSYKIELNKSVGNWEGQKVLNLNKHPYDPIKYRNKLNFDYLKNIENLTSLRTDFVVLYIKDQTSGSDTFEPYGLYTMIENYDDDFLKSHGLDKKGQLYKAEYFEFRRHEEDLKLKDDMFFVRENFEKILESKADDNHKDLIAMLDAVNDENIPINEVIETYFNRDNFLTWLSYNIVVGNIDTNTQNYYLYSPDNEAHFYFLPWDYDGAWGYYDNNYGGSILPKWQYSPIQNYWNVVLIKRFLKEPSNVETLSSFVDKITKEIASEKVKEKLSTYLDVTWSVIENSPDLSGHQIYNKSGYEGIISEIERISEIASLNRGKYYESIDLPMPIFMGIPVVTPENIEINWDPSYDLQGGTLSYTFKLSQDPDFETVLLEETMVDQYQIKFKLPQKGIYYYTVIITDEDGNSMVPFDTLRMDGNTYEGTLKWDFQNN